MILLGTYLRRWQRLLRRLTLRPMLRRFAYFLLYGLAGFMLSAASLGNQPQPFPMALLCAGLPGWLPVSCGLCSVVGYWFFWGTHGLQGIVWIAASLPACLFAQRHQKEMHPLLSPALAALIVAASGVLFQTWQNDQTSIAIYLLRICLAFGTTCLIPLLRSKRDTAADWLALAIGILALAQIAPLRFLNLGIVAGSALVGLLPFPAIALAGLALDLARIQAIPMTAVLCVAALLRLLPRLPRTWHYVIPTMVYTVIMALCSTIDLLPIPALLLGGVINTFLPKQIHLSRHHSHTDSAQLRLELAAQVLNQSHQLLQEERDHPIDESALILKAADRACGTCPCRKGCKELEAAKQLPESLLHRPLIHVDDVPVACKKRGRLMLELRRGQDQYRILKADRDRQEEYRTAVLQQYHFLSEYLQSLSEELPRRNNVPQQRFQPEVAVCSSGKELANGDRCLWFAGTDCRYYLLLCDGMGTGIGAAEEARAAGDMLRRLLTAGYPARHALRSLNSLCTLRGKAGAVTVDLAEVHLDTGKIDLYKWGAAPSWLLLPDGMQRIGAFGPPPGISVTDTRESVDKLRLHKEETLIMVSDGVNAGLFCQSADQLLAESTGSLPARILELGSQEGADDATAAVIRLTPIRISET